jgi:NAD(P)-dependent dehydrogenase (short-subunit alcohol dehydrogenase family)
MRLQDRVILITGAAGTIGRALAVAIEREGGVPVGSDLSEGAGVALAHDVTREEDWAAIMAEIERRHARLDGLVNNAGVAAIGSIETTTFAEWRRIMAVNADGVFLGCRAAWPLLSRSAKPAIVNVSSVSGLVGGANMAAYNASKGAVRLLTKSVALHGARRDPPIRCNSIHPAFVEGTMVDTMLSGARDPAGAQARMASQIPMRRLADPAEIAASIVFLLCDESGFMTGSELVVDGGLVAG